MSFRAENGSPRILNHDDNIGSGILNQKSSDATSKFMQLDRKIEELESLISKKSKPTFDTDLIEKYDNGIRSISQEITRKITEIRNEIKQPIKTKDKIEATFLLNLQQSQCIRLSNLVSRFRTAQASRKSTPKIFEDENDPISEMYANFEPQLTPDQMTLLHRSEEELRQRNDELSRMVQSMNELNDLFRDVSLLIFEQGTILDRIDSKIEVAIEEVQKGNQHLEAANEHQQSKGYYVYIGVVTLLIIVCLALIIWKK